MTDLAVRDRVGDGGDLALVDAFTDRALAIAASAATPDTRPAYTTAYRAFAAFLYDRYGDASIKTFTVAVVAGWRDELTAQGLSASTVAQRVSAVRRMAAAIWLRARVRPRTNCERRAIWRRRILVGSSQTQVPTSGAALGPAVAELHANTSGCSAAWTTEISQHAPRFAGGRALTAGAPS